MRRLRRGSLTALAVVSLLAGCSRERPANVLLIVMDTTRGDRCGFNGYERPTTPRLDAFARDAVVFRNAWAPAGWTGPSHASLFTGLEPSHHGFLEGNRPYLDDSFDTLAERFAAADYATACYSNNWVVDETFGLKQGFGEYVPMYKEVERKATPARETHRRALEWAEQTAATGKPFFLFINDIEPHLPYEPEAELAAPFLRDAPTEAELAAARAFNHPSGVGYCLGAVQVDDRQMRLLSDLYDGELRALDAEIGDLLDKMKTAGLLDNTIVVVTSDHGEQFGEHGLMDHKFSLHRSLTRVPLVIRFPGRFDGGRTVDTAARLIDVAPTLYELTGVSGPAQMDGASLTANLEGRVVRQVWDLWARHEIELMKFFPGADLSPLFVTLNGVYDGRHHLIRYSDGRDELYDVTADPSENHNLAAGEPEIVRRLHALFDTVD